MNPTSQKIAKNQFLYKYLRGWAENGSRQLSAALLLSSIYFVLTTFSTATAAEPGPTLESGIFGDERLILAANPDSKTLSGYYHDGACRVFFDGKLQPIKQYQRPELGETYDVQSWDPQNPSATFTTTLYSRARGGFADQITLELAPDDVDRPVGCRWRVSLDRAGHVGNALIGVAVMAKPRAQLFKLEQVGEVLRPVPMARAALGRDSGVWINKTYGEVPPGMLAISWHHPSGKPTAGYVRVRDLHSIPPAQNANTTGLSCVTLRDGTFEPLGDCAQRTADGGYVVATEALRQLDFDGRGLATMAIREEGYAYVRRNGRALVVPTFDNFPDEFISGLVRVRIGEKLGYANRRLKVVIPAIYDGAYRFTKGRAWVCIGCVSISDGEHSWYRGGQAICLDTRSRKRPDAECGNAGWVPPQLRE